MLRRFTRPDFDTLETRVMLACDTPGFFCVSGLKWHDLDRNGQREANEPGLAGVTIYADSNLNHELDDGELFVVTAEDDPTTEANELGTYQLSGLPAGEYFIEEIIPEGYVQTYPAILGDIDGPNVYPGSHFLEISSEQEISGTNFGNLLARPGSIRGDVWMDANGNGVRDESEVGLPGVTIYSDLDHDRSFDEGEPHVVTGEDDPTTPQNEAGNYLIELESVRRHQIVQLVPQGFEQTFPTSDRFIGETPPLRWNRDGHNVFIDTDTHFEHRDFALRRPETTTGVIEGVVWEDTNGDGELDRNEALSPGAVVYVDLNANGRRDLIEPFDVTGKTASTTGFQITLAPGSTLYDRRHPKVTHRRQT